MSSQIDSLIMQAVKAFESGSLKSAEQLLEVVLQLQKKHLIALHLMGLVKAASADHRACIYFLGQAEKLSPNDPSIQYNLAKAFSDSGNDRSAIIHHERATRLDPQNFMACLNYGQCLSNLGRFSDALKMFERAHALNPGSLEALLNIGATLKELGRFDKAIAIADQAINANPQFAEAWSNKGSAYKGLNQHESALDCYEKAVSLQPNNAQFWSNKGVALVALTRYKEALDCYEKAIQLFPQFAEAWSNKGSAYKGLNQHESALDCYEKAVSLQPNNAQFWSNKGVALVALTRYKEALDCYEKAIQLFPQFAEAWSNKALAFNDLKRYQEALDSCNTAIRIKPDYQDSYWNRALILLTQGRLKEGWLDYERRWNTTGFEKPQFTGIARLSNLGEVANSKILIWSEQGLGDVIQFSRYLSSLNQLGGKITVHVQPPLEQLLRRSGFELLQKDSLPTNFDYQIPFGSLPLLFDTSLESVPGEIPYLRASAESIIDWQKKLTPLKSGKLNIGIACSGNINFDLRRGNTRPIPLHLLINALPGENLFLIQRDLRVGDRETLNQSPAIQYLGEQLTEFEATAAVVECMDLIISIDTSLAHLAGALGKKTFVLLPWAADWRWFLDRDDSPWYPTLKLFRQASFGDWSSVIDRMKIELDHLKSE